MNGTRDSRSRDDDRPWRLHDREETAVGPKLAEALVAHLDAACGTADPTEAQRLQAALARLARDHTDLHGAVVAMSRPGATLRAVAPTLGVSPKTVCLRRHRGLALLRAWLRADRAAHGHVA